MLGVRPERTSWLLWLLSQSRLRRGQPSRKAGWSWGFVAAVNREERTMWIVDAHRVDGNVLSHVQMTSLRPS